MRFLENVSLQDFSNYKIGGPARYFFEAKTQEELLGAVEEADKKELPIFILGAGTNILFSDDGFNRIVIKPNIKHLRKDGNKITAGAGVLMTELLDFAAENNLSGLEWAGGLPGTLGGAIRGNAGCFGKEIKDCVEEVKSLDKNTSEILSRRKDECKFGYRTSVFKSGEEAFLPPETYGVAGFTRGKREVILEAVLILEPGEKEKILSSAREKIEYRVARQPLEYPNIGSIFKNVPLVDFSADLQKELASHIKTDPFPVVPAAVLISLAELKGRRVGDAQVSEKHTNFIVNLADAKANDVLALIDIVKKEVSKKFGVLLELEVELAGFVFG